MANVGLRISDSTTSGHYFNIIDNILVKSVFYCVWNWWTRQGASQDEISNELLVLSLYVKSIPVLDTSFDIIDNI